MISSEEFNKILGWIADEENIKNYLRKSSVSI
jgi:hypothetical protein